MTDKTDSAAKARPLSPHLQIYHWPLSMALSIAHRITGVGLALGSAVFAWWLIAIALGPEPYAAFEAVAGTWFGKLALAGIAWSLMFHLANGIRHLAWDLGFGFSINASIASGVAVMIASVVLSAGIIAAAWMATGTSP